MQILCRITLALSSLCLTGCGALGSTGSSLLNMPMNLINGMTKAVGRSAGMVSQNSAPVMEPDALRAIAARGREIGQKGDYEGVHDHGPLPAPREAPAAVAAR